MIVAVPLDDITQITGLLPNPRGSINACEDCLGELVNRYWQVVLWQRNTLVFGR
jgi:hypothetical protein